MLVEHYQGLGSRVWGAGSKVQDLGSRIQGSRWNIAWNIAVNRSLSIGRVKDESESERREGV